MFGQDRRQMREFFLQAWRKRSNNQILEPLEALVADVVAQHPEYHRILENPESVELDFANAEGEINPFLHMSLHVALKEQLSIDRPPGVKAAYQGLLKKVDDAHDAEHRIMECLGQVLWEAQRAGTPPDEGQYLECLKKL